MNNGRLFGEQQVWHLPGSTSTLLVQDWPNVSVCEPAWGRCSFFFGAIVPSDPFRQWLDVGQTYSESEVSVV